jgi:hypothetical protein
LTAQAVNAGFKIDWSRFQFVAQGQIPTPRGLQIKSEAAKQLVIDGALVNDCSRWA